MFLSSRFLYFPSPARSSGWRRELTWKIIVWLSVWLPIHFACWFLLCRLLYGKETRQTPARLGEGELERLPNHWLQCSQLSLQFSFHFLLPRPDLQKGIRRYKLSNLKINPLMMWNFTYTQFSRKMNKVSLLLSFPLDWSFFRSFLIRSEIFQGNLNWKSLGWKSVLGLEVE